MAEGGGGGGRWWWGHYFTLICSSVGRRCDLSVPTFARLQTQRKHGRNERSHYKRRKNEPSNLGKKRETETEAKKEKEYRRQEGTKPERKGNTWEEEHANKEKRNGEQLDRSTYEETNN